MSGEGRGSLVMGAPEAFLLVTASVFLGMEAARAV